MKAVIMAGGEGCRLRPLTSDRPKPLVPVCGRPVMGYLLDLLVRHRFQEVFVTLGYLSSAIPATFGERYQGMRIHYIVEESPLGTAGSVAALRGQLDSTFLVVSGDVLTDFDVSGLVATHRQTKALATIATVRVENPLEYGVVMTDRSGRVSRFLEKPSWGEVFSDTINTGVYILEQSVLEGVPPERNYDFSQHLFPALIQMEAPLYASQGDGYWRDIGDPAAYLQANLDLLSGKLSFDPPGRPIAPGVWTSGPAPDGVMIDGPAFLGEGCRIGPGVRLEGGVVLGPATVVGAGSVLRRSVTWSGVHIGNGATLCGTVLCDGAALGDGACLSEGAVIGAGCSVGEKVAVAPGVRLWPKTIVPAEARVDHTLVPVPVWPGHLLRKGGIHGRIGVDLVPENALRVGSAFASILATAGSLVIGCDGGPGAELLKRALICGALAAGRSVLDVGVTAAPVVEFTITSRVAAGGLHVRSGAEQVRVAFYDAAGRPLGRNYQRRLEQACLRQDFLRAAPDALGTVEGFMQAEWLYLEHLSEQIDLDVIRAADLRIHVDGEGGAVLHRWLERLRCKRCSARPHLRISLDSMEGTWRLGQSSPDSALALEMMLHGCMQEASEEVAIPVTASRGVEALLRGAGRRPVRVRQADWRPRDPLLGIGRLLEWMTRERLTEEAVLSRLPRASMADRVVACPWEAKGRVMRQLLEQHADQPVDLVDGLRIDHGDGWALLLPDPDEPVYRILVEGADQAAAEARAQEYARRVEALIRG